MHDVEGRLLERDSELRALIASVEEAAAGRGSAVLLFGEAGIGKTSVVRAFLRSIDGTARVFLGVCDDLVTPRTLGPLRDAVAVAGGPLADALAGEPDREEVYRVLFAELSRSGAPTVLVIEDVHWADDATLDALRFIARRLEGLRCVLVLTYRDEELAPDHPLRRLLGALSGVPARRLPLRRLSRAAVTQLWADAHSDCTTLYAITRGNPFFVTEVLAAPLEYVPATVVDAVMARLRDLPPASRAALEQLAVVPSRVEPWLLAALVDDLGPIAEVERRGMVEVQPEGLAFRHELARRALEQTLPAVRRMELNRAVVDALLGRDDADLSRVVHHAVAAGDVATVLARGPAAAREAAKAGSHRQSLAHYEHVVAHLDLLPDDARAQILSEYAWQLYLGQRWHESVEVARRAVSLWEPLDDPVELSDALVVLSRSAYMADRPREAMVAAERAELIATTCVDVAALAQARSYRGALLALTDQQDRAVGVLTSARDLAEQVDRRDLVAHSLNYLGCAQVDLGDLGGLDLLRLSLETALAAGHHEYAARAYTNLGETLFLLRRYDELEQCIAAGLAYVTERDLLGHAYNLEAHRGMVRFVRGQWDEAERILRGLHDAVPDPGQLARLTLPTIGRLLARRGDPAAEEVTRQAWQVAQRSDTLLALAPAGLARIEWAWLSGDLELAAEECRVLLARTANPAGARRRGELLRYLARAGRANEPFADCPDEWAAGLRGDWRAAAAAWQRIGDPYERALELAGSGEAAPMLQALEILDGLGAGAAATLVRRTLRRAGVSHVPRGPQPATRANPSGLTDRQLNVLNLLAEGLTNAEIADRLVLSTRTVDHHVSAILTKLGVSTRRDAARFAAHLNGNVP